MPPAKKRPEKNKKSSTTSTSKDNNNNNNNKDKEKADVEEVISAADQLRREGIVATYALNSKKIHRNVRDISGLFIP